MPLISGTMLIYTEWCSVTLKGFFCNKRYQRLYKKGEMKKCHMVFVFLGNLSSAI